MRVLIVSDVLAYGGASKLINDMVPRLIASNCECDLLILTDSNAKYIDVLRQQGISVTVIPNGQRGWIKGTWYIKKFIENGRYDVVHVNLFPVLYYCSLAKRLLGKNAPKFIFTEHSTDNRRRHMHYLRALEQFIYRAYDSVVSISDKTQVNIIEWLKPNKRWKTEFMVIQNGIPLESFQKAAGYDRKVLVTNYKDEKLLLMIGSFTEQKNHSFMLDVLKDLPSNYKLLLAGEGPLLMDIQNVIKEKQLEDRVILLGFRKDIAEVMKTVDIVVIPSKWEGFGLIAAESMASGIPVVASDVDGLSEVIGDAGIKVNTEDVTGFCRAIIKLESPEEYEKYVRLGVDRSRTFDIDNFVISYKLLYERIMHRQI